MNEHHLAATTELMGAVILNSLDSETTGQLKADPKATIYAKTNIELSDMEIKVVENTSRDVALILPCYETLERTRADAIADADIAEISAGEIIISIIAGALIGSSIALMAGAASGGTAVFTGIAIGAAVGGIVGTAAASSVVVGGVVGANNK